MANVHLDATEHEDHVVFMHNIQEGPANRSFGLQVAKLAGVPDSVLSLARDKLTQLETGKIQLETVAPPAQNDFFLAPDTHPVIEKLQGLNLDDLSPRRHWNYCTNFANSCNSRISKRRRRPYPCGVPNGDEQA